jgi:hypothetical protein
LDAGQRPPQVLDHLVERSLRGGVSPSDEDVVPPRAAGFAQDDLRHGTQAALGAVPRHSVADLSGAGEADADGFRLGIAGPAVVGLQDEAGRGLAARTCGTQKVRSVTEAR